MCTFFEHIKVHFIIVNQQKSAKNVSVHGASDNFVGGKTGIS